MNSLKNLTAFLMLCLIVSFAAPAFAVNEKAIASSMSEAVKQQQALNNMMASGDIDEGKYLAITDKLGVIWQKIEKEITTVENQADVKLVKAVCKKFAAKGGVNQQVAKQAETLLKRRIAFLKSHGAL
jgi:hypothetical protein